MHKIKLAVIGFFLACSLSNASAQGMRLGSSVISLGFNYCTYTAISTNLCGLHTTNGSFPGFSISPSYSYAVLNNVTLDGTLGVSIYGGGTGIDIGLGASYNLFFPAHNANPFEAFIKFSAGYTNISLKNGLISDTGRFNSGGLFLTPGIGLRKYLFGDVAIFIDVNYALYSYTDGEVQENSNYKLPFALTFSGFNFGGGVCWRLGAARTGTSTTY